MMWKFLRFGGVLVLLSAPRGGCLAIVGHKINREPSAPQSGLCRPGVQSNGETVGYGCAPAARAAS